MANLTNLIDFTAVFRTVGPTLTLQNTGAYGSGVSVTTRWEVRPPASGLTGPVITATGSSAVISLPLATDGTYQIGVYQIKCIVNDGTDDSPLTRILPITLTPQAPKPAQQIDYALPKLVYVDTQDYAQLGYSSPTVARSWNATRTFSTTPFTSTAATFDLAVAGYYYFDIYTVSLTVTATYIPTGLSWATIIATYTVQDFIDSNALPTLQQMRGWLSDNDKHDCGCGGGCGDCAQTEAACIYGLIKEYACDGQFDDVLRQVKNLYKATHHGQPFKLKPDGSILQAVQLCPDAASCGAAATSFTFDQITATTVRINIVGSALLIYDLLIQPGNKTFLGVVDGQVLTGLTSSTAYTAPVLTTRCTTGTPNSVTGTGFTTASSLVSPVVTVNDLRKVYVGFSWPALAGYDNYITEFYSDSARTQMVGTQNISATSDSRSGLTPNTPYWARTKGNDSTGTLPDSGWGNWQFTTWNNLTISTQPQSVSKTDGQSATFNLVAAGGKPTLAYQWYQTIGTNTTAVTNGGVFSGATTATLTISDVTGFNGRVYYCIVVDADTPQDSAISNNGTLTVQSAGLQAPTLIIQRSATTLKATVNNPSGGVKVVWQVSSDINFTSPTSRDINYPGTIREASSLTPATTYYSRAKTVDANGVESPYSATISTVTFDTQLRVNTQNPAPSAAGLGVTFFSQSSANGGVNPNQELHFNSIAPGSQLGVSSDTDINEASAFQATATIDNAYLATGVNEFAYRDLSGVMQYGPVGNNAKFVNGTYTF